MTLSAPSHQVITVDYQTPDSTATILDQDYLAASGTVTFTIGQTNQWITTTINGDTKYELDESFLVNLANPVNAALVVNQVAGLIIDDDTQPQVSIDDVSEYEGDSGSKVFTFTVSLSNLSYQSVDLDYTTTDGTATVINNDYLPISGTLSIPANLSTATIPVVVIGDVTLETNEVFSIDISNLTNATPGAAPPTARRIPSPQSLCP